MPRLFGLLLSDAHMQKLLRVIAEVPEISSLQQAIIWAIEHVPEASVGPSLNTVTHRTLITFPLQPEMEIELPPGSHKASVVDIPLYNLKGQGQTIALDFATVNALAPNQKTHQTLLSGAMLEDIEW